MGDTNTAFTDPNINLTTDSGLSAAMKTFYNTELLDNARSELYHTQFARRQPLPAGRGKTVEWRRWNTLPNASGLTEGVVPDGTKLGMTTVTAALGQYGIYVTVSDALETHAVDDVILGAVEELGASAGETEDILARNTMAAGTNVIYAPKSDGTEVTARTGLDKTCTLTPDLVNRAVTLLKKLKTPRINGKYVAIIHPSVAYDLRGSDEWVDVHKYCEAGEIFNGEIGELHGCRFVETTNAKIWGDACSDGAVYATLFLGKDAIGIVDPEGAGLEMIVHSRGEAGGPLDQFSTVGYKLSTASVILYEDRMVRVESCSAYSGVDAAN